MIYFILRIIYIILNVKIINIITSLISLFLGIVFLVIALKSYFLDKNKKESIRPFAISVALILINIIDRF